VGASWWVVSLGAGADRGGWVVCVWWAGLLGPPVGGCVGRRSLVAWGGRACAGFLRLLRCSGTQPTTRRQSPLLSGRVCADRRFAIWGGGLGVSDVGACRVGGRSWGGLASCACRSSGCVRLVMGRAGCESRGWASGRSGACVAAVYNGGPDVGRYRSEFDWSGRREEDCAVVEVCKTRRERSRRLNDTWAV